MQDISKTVISQYSGPTLPAIVAAINSYFDPTANIDLFYDQVWNIATAQGWGLDVWGRIVGLPNGRHLNLATTTYFGFSGPGGPSGDSLNNVPFYSGSSVTTNFALSDDAFRTLILAKAAANICDGSIAAINAILTTLFGSEGQAYVIDGGDMTMTYRFKFTLSLVDAAILTQSGALPRSTGVALSIVQGP